jgi:hypothetical protein
LRLNPRHPDATYNLGMILLVPGQAPLSDISNGPDCSNQSGKTLGLI